MKPQVITIAFEDALPDQLREYAMQFLNLELPPEASDSQVRAAIQQASPGITQIFALEQPADEQPAIAPPEPETVRPEEQANRTAGTLGKGDPRAIIHIPVIETEDGSGGKDVILGVNGRAWQLKRGFDLDVPWRVVEALKNATQIVVRHNPETGDETRRSAQRFPFEFIKKPPEAEVEAWTKRMSEQFCA